MDPQVEGLLTMMKAQAEAAGAPPMWELPADVARAGAELSFDAFNGTMPASVTVTDRTVPGPAGDIPVKVFRPQGTGPFPLLVYIHGGGWVIGSPNTHRQLCAELAEGAGVVVLSVHYRLAPEHPAPAALEDCVAAIRWAVANAAAIDARPDRFAIGGDSAGGNLTAASALWLRDNGGPTPSFLLLLYGAYAMDFDTPSYHANGKGYILEQDAMVWFRDHYLSGGADANDPYVSPLKANLANLPPALLVVGTLDPLLDDSRLFAEALRKAGGTAALSEYQDMPHVFLQLTAMLDGAKKGLSECTTALRTALA
ncbi:MAG: alpha/beta hydrolase [Dehalococcoidia bacterium]|nr:alpha/beta hydrolase [Dehalococcoidia bacterium]